MKKKTIFIISILSIVIIIIGVIAILITNDSSMPSVAVSIPFTSHIFIGDSYDVLEYTFDESIVVDGRYKQVDNIIIPIHFVVHQPYYEWFEEPDCYRIGFPPCGYNVLAYREFNIDGYEYIYNRYLNFKS